MSRYILAIDQGTTNSRAIIFDSQGQLIKTHERELPQFYPELGWTEQDPETMFSNTVTCCQTVVQESKISPHDIVAVGITNQRETTIIWDKKTGKPIYPAIVWLDRRTHLLCQEIATLPIAKSLPEKTGLILDPYFSATKIMWILKHVPEAREKAERNELLFGTVDCYLLWKLTNGATHATDATNASRTLLFNIHTQEWDNDILTALNIPKNILPTVLDNTADFGMMAASILGRSIPIAGMAGDQQAATIGQSCFQPGMIKTTYGTGCFMMLNTGDKVVQSKQQLLSTIAYRIQKKVTYGLEGSIFSAGTIIKWLRDSLQIIHSASETEALAKSLNNNGNVYLVPAFAGLGAPYWRPDVQGALFGLTQNATRAHIVRAALESVVYQTCDLLNAMQKEDSDAITTMRVDGGMAANKWLMQFLADMLNIKIELPTCLETTALGAAYLAGLQSGLYQSTDDIAKHWQMQSQFTATIDTSARNKLYEGWQQAVNAVLNKASFK